MEDTPYRLNFGLALVGQFDTGRIVADMEFEIVKMVPYRIVDPPVASQEVLELVHSWQRLGLPLIDQKR